MPGSIFASMGLPERDLSDEEYEEIYHKKRPTTRKWWQRKKRPRD